ncbi:MAG: hypothetical protein AAGF11_54575 [Myxococcota bacterium]
MVAATLSLYVGGVTAPEDEPAKEAVGELQGLSDELVRDALALEEEGKHGKAARKMQQAYEALSEEEAVGAYGRALLQDALGLYNQAYEETGDLDYLDNLHAMLEDYFERLEQSGALEDIAPRELKVLRKGLEVVLDVRVQRAKSAFEAGDYEEAAYQAKTCYRAIRASERTSQRAEWVLLLASRAYRESWLVSNRVSHLKQAQSLLKSHILLGPTVGSRQVKNELLAVNAALKAAVIVGESPAGDLHKFPRTARDRDLLLVTGTGLAAGGLLVVGSAILAGTAITRRPVSAEDIVRSSRDWEQIGMAVPLALGGSAAAVLSMRALVRGAQVTAKQQKIIAFSATPIGGLCLAVGVGLLASGIGAYHSERPVELEEEVPQVERAIRLQRVGLGISFAGMLPLGVGIGALIARSRTKRSSR